MPTDVPRTGEELPESPPIGAPASEADADSPDGSLVWADWALSTVEPGRIAIAGLILDMRVLVEESGLE